jgi:hypothetical protein
MAGLGSDAETRSELAVLFTLPLTENNINFGLKKLRGKFPTAIEDQLLAFQNSDDYLYLNELRNTVQHRRIWLEHTRSFFNIHPVTGGEKPIEVKILLPDQPIALPGTQTYVQNEWNLHHLKGGGFPVTDCKS